MEEHSQVLEALCAHLATTAITRDAAGGTPLEERAAIRESGLLALTIPRELGGAGQSFGTLLDVVRRVAQVDPALAHVLAFHHLMLQTLQLFGSEEQWRGAFEHTAREKLFWGNALNPRDTRTRLTSAGADLRISGKKSFSSGARDSDRLIVSALDDTDKLVVAAIPTRRLGIATLPDWNAFGQRQTDSGTVVFDDVRIEEREILRTPGPLGNPRASLRPCLAQAILVHVYLGIAQGAWEEVRARHRGGGEARSSDPYVQLRAGELALDLAAADLFAARARSEIDRELARGEDVDTRGRGELALHVARAKVTSTRAGLAITSGLFELLGPRATGRPEALDRYWRNLRVHTLHDPVDHKLRELGELELTDRVPTPGFYA